MFLIGVSILTDSFDPAGRSQFDQLVVEREFKAVVLHHLAIGSHLGWHIRFGEQGG